MSTPRLSVHLTNNRFVKVVEWKGDPRLDLREWHREGKILKATKKGISLNLTQIKALIDILEDGIEDNRRKNQEFSWHLGANVFVSVRKDNPCIDVRLNWRPPQGKEVVPTKVGLCLRPDEYECLKDNITDIKGHLPELITVVPCYMRDDHQNQIGMLKCRNCNPDDYQNWENY
ncbi:hypothetical protein FSP39_004116 [Pinctada imbricata]|uniref:Transcriptional coactivator p15 (PC4) C-terminal domain-containing protein n=1 Tax=Pinctada imbricata TaxID=66713 RepID=A0AA88XHQ8_PINIB|nr:hypothetical protein FSP39_004116 [Pinctada imbricata]